MSMPKFIGRYWPIVAAAVGQAIVSLFQDTIKSLLKGIFGDTPTGLVYLLIVLGVTALILFLLDRALKPKPKDLVPPDSKPPKMKGLILLVGKGLQGKPAQEQSAHVAIEYHLKNPAGRLGLRDCWLIASEDSYTYALELKEEFEKRGIEMHLNKVADPYYDVNDTYGVVSKIYDEDLSKAKLAENEVIADFTGGTKPMSLGMAMACLPNNRAMQYMTGRQQSLSSVPVLIKFEPRQS